MTGFNDTYLSDPKSSRIDSGRLRGEAFARARLARSLDAAIPSMRIGLIAPPAVPVPPPVYGGTESVIDRLARGLTARGHSVVLFTVGESTCPVERRWTRANAVGTTAGALTDILHVRDAYSQLTDVELIHDHSLTGPLLPSFRPDGIPVAATLHSDLTPPFTAALRRLAGDVDLIAISHDQRRSAADLRIRSVIHHGIDVADYPLGDGAGGYLLFLGRMHPTKGVHRAIAVARASGRRLLIAAKMWEPDECEYFTEVIEPMLGADVEFIGQAGPAEKAELLAHAEALVNPIRWREPFGLVMIEAMACGTPVLAFPEGAATEIVDNGVTGYLCRDVSDMAAAVDKAAALDRSTCRRRCVDRFSTEQMVARHVMLYASVLERREAAASVPSYLTEAG